jgi:hypothetical protein
LCAYGGEKAISISGDFQDFDFSNEGFDDEFGHCDGFGNLFIFFFFLWHAVVEFYVFWGLCRPLPS